MDAPDENENENEEIENEREDGELKQNGDEDEDLDDDSDDGVNVVIGNIKPNTSYSAQQQQQHSIKRGELVQLVGKTVFFDGFFQVAFRRQLSIKTSKSSNLASSKSKSLNRLERSMGWRLATTTWIVWRINLGGNPARISPIISTMGLTRTPGKLIAKGKSGGCY